MDHFCWSGFKFTDSFSHHLKSTIESFNEFLFQLLCLYSNPEFLLKIISISLLSFPTFCIAIFIFLSFFKHGFLQFFEHNRIAALKVFACQYLRLHRGCLLFFFPCVWITLGCFLKIGKYFKYLVFTLNTRI